MIEPKDLLGRPIQEGDLVARSVSGYGSSPSMTVGRIVSVDFRCKNPDPNNWRKVNIKCSQAQADSYTLRIETLVEEGGATFTNVFTGDKRFHGLKPDDFPSDWKGNVSTIKLVKNIVKLDEGALDDLLV